VPYQIGDAANHFYRARQKVNGLPVNGNLPDGQQNRYQ
jgi:hypothetical protein